MYKLLCWRLPWPQIFPSRKIYFRFEYAYYLQYIMYFCIIQIPLFAIVTIIYYCGTSHERKFTIKWKLHQSAYFFLSICLGLGTVDNLQWESVLIYPSPCWLFVCLVWLSAGLLLDVTVSASSYTWEPCCLWKTIPLESPVTSGYYDLSASSL